MRIAEIELTNYFVSEMRFSANRDFDKQKPSSFGIDDLQVTPEVTAKTEDRRDWQIALNIALDAPKERNVPYSFHLEIVGLAHVSDSIKDENIERFTRINGTSMVFSAAREIIRAVTSRGPFPPVLLPTVTFWEAKPQPPPVDVNPEPPEASVQE